MQWLKESINTKSGNGTSYNVYVLLGRGDQNLISYRPVVFKNNFLLTLFISTH